MSTNRTSKNRKLTRELTWHLWKSLEIFERGGERVEIACVFMNENQLNPPPPHVIKERAKDRLEDFAPEHRAERERDPTEDEERGWSTHVEKPSLRGTGWRGAPPSRRALRAPFHPRFFRPMAKRCPLHPHPHPPHEQIPDPAPPRTLPPGEEGASKKKVRPHARLEPLRSCLAG